MERATYDSVAFRFIAANDHPDHDTIAAFRRRFLDRIEGLFVEVLLLAREAGVRTLSLDVLRVDSKGAPVSVLASGRPKEVRVDAEASEQNVTLFFHSAQSFSTGEILHLDIRDVETTEQFPPGGIKLTLGRDM